MTPTSSIRRGFIIIGIVGKNIQKGTLQLHQMHRHTSNVRFTGAIRLEASQTWGACPPAETFQKELSELNPHTTGVPYAGGGVRVRCAELCGLPRTYGSVHLAQLDEATQSPPDVRGFVRKTENDTTLREVTALCIQISRGTRVK